jgi:hypothetical protein
MTGTNRESPTDNSTLAIGVVSCSADRSEVTESFVLRMKISSKRAARQKYANHEKVMHHFGEIHKIWNSNNLN